MPLPAFDPLSAAPYRLSRTKLELFLECPRCFYLDRRLGIARPSGPMPQLNITIDTLMKREFDAFRLRREPHPVMTAYGLKAIPFLHERLEEWRDPWRGVTVTDAHLGFTVFGALDDVWIDDQGRLIVVDYKASSRAGPIPPVMWNDKNKRQLEVYQWLLRRNGFHVDGTAYFVFANGRKDQPDLGDALQFNLTLIPHRGPDSWIPDALSEARICLCRESLPEPHLDCEWCSYRRASAVTEWPGI